MKTTKSPDKLTPNKNNNSKQAFGQNNSSKLASGKNNNNGKLSFDGDNVEYAKKLRKLKD